MKKFFISCAFILLLCCAIYAQTANNNYYKIKVSIFENMPRTESGIVFLGDSLTDYVKFDELFPDLNTKNRGIAGDTTVGVLNRIDEVVSLKPSKLFLLIGTNDIVFNMKAEETVSNIKKIIEIFNEKSPNTVIYVQTLFPVNHNLGDKRRPHKAIRAINNGIKKLSEEMNFVLIDTYSLFAENGEMPERYTVDGVHLNGAGVVRWVEFLSKWIKEER